MGQVIIRDGKEFISDLSEDDEPVSGTTTKNGKEFVTTLSDNDEPLVGSGRKVEPGTGLFTSIGNNIKSGLEKTFSGAADLITGESRTDPKTAHLPELGSQGAGSSLPLGQGAKVSTALTLAAGENVHADIIRDIVPGAEFMVDDKQNILVKFPEESEFAFLNKPGVSMQDFANLMGQLLLFTPAGKMLKGSSLMLRAPAVATTSGAISYAQDVGSIAAGSKQGLDHLKAMFTTLGGGLGEVAMPAIQGFFRELIKRGPLDAAGVEQLMMKAGIDPRLVTQEFMDRVNNPAFRDEVSAAMRGSAPAASGVVNRALSDEFDVPLTQGQATQELSTISSEQNALGSAKSVLRDFEADKQVPAIERAAESLTKQGRDGLPSSRLDAAEGAREALESRAAGYRDSIDDAFNAVQSSGGLRLRAGSMDGIFKRFIKTDGGVSKVVDSKTGTEIVVDELTPASLKAIKDIDNLMPKLTPRPDPPKLQPGFTASHDVKVPSRKNRKPIPLAQINQTRKILNQRFDQADNATDRHALRIIKNEYDRWLDDAVDNSLFDGDASSLEALKNARKMRKIYGDLFEQRNSDDIAGRVINKIIREPNINNLEVVNWLFGASKIGHSRTANRVVDRMVKIFGNDSPQIDSIRQASVRNLFFSPKSEQPYVSRVNPVAGYRKIVENISDYVEGAGSEYSKKLHTPEQLAELTRFRDLMKLFIAPRSTMDVSSKLEAAFNKIVETTGFLAGSKFGSGFLGLQGGKVGTRTLGNIKRDRAARRSIDQFFSTIKPRATIQIGPAIGSLSASTPAQD